VVRRQVFGRNAPASRDGGAARQPLEAVAVVDADTFEVRIVQDELSRTCRCRSFSTVVHARPWNAHVSDFWMEKPAQGPSIDENACADACSNCDVRTDFCASACTPHPFAERRCGDISLEPNRDAERSLESLSDIEMSPARLWGIEGVKWRSENTLH